MLNSRLYQKISIIGGGLMGTSLAFALQEQQIAQQILILLKSKEQIAKITALDIKATINYKDLIDSELIFLAIPLASYADIFNELAKLNLPKNIIISDLGSVKTDIINLAQAKIAANIFVPAHPIAGSEKSGTGTLVKNLYQGKKIIITQLQDQNSETVANIWLRIGAKIEYMPPSLHDEIYAYVSHLVQKIAFHLNYLLHHSRKDITSLREIYQSPDFNKFTRLYFSHHKMWQDIFAFNKTHLAAALCKIATSLQELIVKLDELISRQEAEVSNLNIKNLDLLLASLLAGLVQNVVKENVNNYQKYIGSGFADFVKIAESQKVELTDLTKGELGYLRDRLANLLNYLH